MNWIYPLTTLLLAAIAIPLLWRKLGLAILLLLAWCFFLLAVFAFLQGETGPATVYATASAALTAFALLLLPLLLRRERTRRNTTTPPETTTTKN